MSEIDVPAANEILPNLGDPPLAEREVAISRADPNLSAADVLDLALTEAILELRYTLNRQTFEFLKWKVVAARATARRARDAMIASRADRIATRERLARRYRDSDWEIWSVTEITGNSGAPAGARCLIFTSATMMRRVTEFPENWRELSDAELEQISWNH